MLRTPGSHFTVCLNLQAHATAFKATLIQKLYKSNVSYTNTFDLCLKNFTSPRIKGWLPGVPSTGESFKKSKKSMNKQKNQNGPKTCLMGPGGADKWKKNWIQKILWDCPFKCTYNGTRKGNFMKNISRKSRKTILLQFQPVWTVFVNRRIRNKFKTKNCITCFYVRGNSEHLLMLEWCIGSYITWWFFKIFMVHTSKGYAIIGTIF